VGRLATRAAAILVLALAAGCASAHHLEGVPDVIASNSYSCGPAATQAVLMFYGIWGHQDEYAKELGTTPDAGTNPGAIVAFLKKKGLDAELKQDLSLDDLRRYVDDGVPVIIDFQAWHDWTATHDYTAEWEDGHYGVLTGYDDHAFYIEDPSLLGTVGFVEADDLLARWHDSTTIDDRPVKFIHAGIVVRGKPVPQPPFTPIK
jgi:predicted double-glycine peptidase